MIAPWKTAHHEILDNLKVVHGTGKKVNVVSGSQRYLCKSEFVYITPQAMHKFQLIGNRKNRNMCGYEIVQKHLHVVFLT